MTMGVFDFKAIRLKVERLEQKADFEAKNPPVDTGMYGWPYGVAMPLTSLAHPEWPYTGTPHEWRRVNAEYREYAITQGRFGDEFVKLPNGSSLSRPITE